MYWGNSVLTAERMKVIYPNLDTLHLVGVGDTIKIELFFGLFFFFCEIDMQAFILIKDDWKC